jgi:hypothetical protein
MTLDWQRVARAHAHPLRVRILELMAEDVARPWSPVQLSDEFDVPLANLSYHVRALERMDLIELTAVAPQRGALEHFYTLKA